MKSTIIVVLFTIVFFESSGQVIPSTAQAAPSIVETEEAPKDPDLPVKKHLITIAPLGLINKVRVRYEYVYSKKASIGFQYSHYYDENFPGFQAVVEGRRYLSESAPLGFYLKGQFGLAYHYTTAYDGIYSVTSPSGYLSLVPPSTTWMAKETYQVQSSGIMTGLGLGYQFGFGKRNKVTMDLYAGIRTVSMNHDLDNYWIRPQNWAPPGDFLFSKESPFKKGQFSVAPDMVGGVLNCGINIGYRF